MRFADVAGIDEVVDSLQDLLVFLTEPERFEKLGAKLPRGVIFHGPPGTGKTLLAKALAGEAGVPFFPVAGSEFVEMIVGRGAARVRALFADAAQLTAAIIFFDEFDALAKRRSNVSISGNDEREQTLNQLLVELDGFDAEQPDHLHRRHQPASTRSTRRCCVPAASASSCSSTCRPRRAAAQILAVHARTKPLDGEVDLDRLAHITFGTSGADLADMLNRAAILAGKAHQDEITQAEPGGRLPGRDRRAGQAQRRRSPRASGRWWRCTRPAMCSPRSCARAVEKAMRVSIQPRGRAGGMAVYGRTDRMLQDQQYLHEKLVGDPRRPRRRVRHPRRRSPPAPPTTCSRPTRWRARPSRSSASRPRPASSSASQGGQQVRVSEETVALIDGGGPPARRGRLSGRRSGSCPRTATSSTGSPAR